MKNDYILTEEKVDQIDHVLHLLDTSLEAMQQLSLSMMPEILHHKGLKEALSEYFDETKEKFGYKVNFQYLGTPARIASPLEIILYKVATELVNNRSLHPEASRIDVLVNQNDYKIYLLVQGNGKGFDISSMNLSKSGILNDIRLKVEQFQGTFDIDSSPKKGTKIDVEFFLSGQQDSQ